MQYLRLDNSRKDQLLEKSALIIDQLGNELKSSQDINTRLDVKIAELESKIYSDPNNFESTLPGSIDKEDYLQTLEYENRRLRDEINDIQSSAGFVQPSEQNFQNLNQELKTYMMNTLSTLETQTWENDRLRQELDMAQKTPRSIEQRLSKQIEVLEKSCEQLTQRNHELQLKFTASQREVFDLQDQLEQSNLEKEEAIVKSQQNRNEQTLPRVSSPKKEEVTSNQHINEIESIWKATLAQKEVELRRAQTQIAKLTSQLDAANHSLSTIQGEAVNAANASTFYKTKYEKTKDKLRRFGYHTVMEQQKQKQEIGRLKLHPDDENCIWKETLTRELEFLCTWVRQLQASRRTDVASVVSHLTGLIRRIRDNFSLK